MINTNMLSSEMLLKYIITLVCHLYDLQGLWVHHLGVLCGYRLPLAYTKAKAGHCTAMWASLYKMYIPLTHLIFPYQLMHNQSHFNNFKHH